jgi:hypothetical protein
MNSIRQLKDSYTILRFILLLVFPAAQGLAQNRISEEDSLIVISHIWHAKLSSIDNEGIDTSALTPDEADNILKDANTDIYDGKVYYSSDTFFKIFVIEGEGCGANCGTFWVSYLHLKNASGRIFPDLDIKPISEIVIMPDGKYLIFQETSERCGPTYCSTQTATLISFDHDSLITHPWYYKDPRYENTDEPEPKESFTIWQEGFIDEPIEMYYDKKSKRLTYRYSILDPNLEEAEEGFYKAMLYEGYFVYEKGAFAAKKETARETKVREDD